MKKIILFLSILGFNLYAADVSKFDIKGLRLGMSEKEVMRKLKSFCSNPKIYSTDHDKDIKCGNIHVVFGYNKLAYYISKEAKHSYLINKEQVNILKEKIFTKYGKPSISEFTTDPYDYYTFCWDDASNSDKCYTKNNQAYRGQLGKYLEGIIETNPNNNKTLVRIWLQDEDLDKKQFANYERALKKSRDNKIKNFDF